MSTTAAPESTSVVTYPLVDFFSTGAYVGSVVDANPTATTLVVNCAPQVVYCKVTDTSVTVGQWAQPTSPPTERTGGSTSAEVPKPTRCVIDDNLAIVPTYTYTRPRYEMFGMEQVPITITAGVEKLASASAAAVTATGHSNAAAGALGVNMSAIGLVALLVAYVTR
ncbi:hypothetical protein K461DRAFT_269883 [Myriangium duriaei CBS 260.36]|uniref:Uncharacterized protein n=1 Tax=Myriangium duriaei CBS 260.36 TaxID=1168546 RepID=A0A9P4IUY0_9PEZI|nr:hypothetical protein K461DRAFT_269883 [Myriangium duriaei CBS 260.36]